MWISGFFSCNGDAQDEVNKVMKVAWSLDRHSTKQHGICARSTLPDLIHHNPTGELGALGARKSTL